MFESTSLADVAFLNSLGYPVTQSKARGSLVVFTLDISETQADVLLRSPEWQTCQAFANAWRLLRREIDRVLIVEGRRR